MGILTRLLSWLWKAFQIFAPIASVLWGATVYSGLAFSLWVIVTQTSNLISEFDATFSSWADGISSNITELFTSVTANSFFQFMSYVTSLDVPFEWVRSCSDTFIRFWLSYAVGAFLVVIETCVIVLGVYFVRSRIKRLALGVGDHD